MAGLQNDSAREGELEGRKSIASTLATGDPAAAVANPWTQQMGQQMYTARYQHGLGAAERERDYKLRVAADSRAAAAESRTAGLYPMTVEGARLDLDAKKRAATAPTWVDLGPGHSRVAYDPKTGAEVSRIAGPPPKLEPTTIKEMHEADDIIRAGVPALATYDKMLELNRTATDGPLVGIRSYIGSIGGGPEADAARNLVNMSTRNALTQLKAIFGGNPTEGERKILLDVEGAMSETRANRERIFREARAALENRIRGATDKRKALASGGYYGAGYDPAAVFRAPPAGGTPPPAGGTPPGAPGAPAPATPPAVPGGAPRAVNPTTGETIEWNGSAWVPVK